MIELSDVLRDYIEAVNHLTEVQRALIHVVLENLPATTEQLEGKDSKKLKAALDELNEATGRQRDFMKPRVQQILQKEKSDG